MKATLVTNARAKLQADLGPKPVTPGPLLVAVKAMIENVLKKYEQETFGKRVLFYPASKPSRLVVVFAGANRGHYAMWSWFYRQNEDWSDCSYLFLTEDTDPNRYWWYLPALVVLAWVANTARVVGICIMALSVGPELAMGSFHLLGGWIVLCVMFFLCWIVFSFAGQIETKLDHAT